LDRAGTESRNPGDLRLDFDRLYQQQWWPMLRLATGLINDPAVAEDIVQDAFAALYRKRESLRHPAAAVGYLRVTVVNLARSVLRRRLTTRRHLRLAREETAEAADSSSVLTAERLVLRAALQALPDRQREVLILRYIAELPDLEIAQATGLSPGGVRSAASRGLAALRGVLGGEL
jgi:RNA polymerase sigma-70 factor (sigma-E family)